MKKPALNHKNEPICHVPTEDYKNGYVNIDWTQREKEKELERTKPKQHKNN